MVKSFKYFISDIISEAVSNKREKNKKQNEIKLQDCKYPTKLEIKNIF